MKPAEIVSFVTYLLIAMLICPGVAGAQTEQESSSFSSNSSRGSEPVPSHPGTKRERFAIGVDMGLSLSQFLEKDGGSDIAEYTMKPAVTFGLSGMIRLRDWLSVRSEVLFVSKGRRTNVDGALFSTLDANYIEVPLLARLEFALGEHVAPYLLAGPALGIFLKYQTTRESDGVVRDLSDEAKSIDLSGILGAGVALALTQQHGLTLEGRYDRSFTRFLESEADVKHSLFAFMLGYQYSFSSPSP